MRHLVPVPHAGAPKIELQRSVVTGRARVLTDGANLPAWRAPREYRVPLADGNALTLDVAPPRWDRSERVLVDGVEIVVVPPLRWFEVIVAFLPLVMIFGGAIFAGVGACTLATTLTVVRGRGATWVRLLLCTGLLVLGLAVATAIGIALTSRR